MECLFPPSNVCYFQHTTRPCRTNEPIYSTTLVHADDDTDQSSARPSISHSFSQNISVSSQSSHTSAPGARHSRSQSVGQAHAQANGYMSDIHDVMEVHDDNLNVPGAVARIARFPARQPLSAIAATYLAVHSPDPGVPQAATGTRISSNSLSVSSRKGKT